MVLPFFGKKSDAGNRAVGAAGTLAAPQPACCPVADVGALEFSRDAARELAECAGLVEVQEVGAGPGAAYDEAAMLYANGSASAAEAVLDALLDRSASDAGEDVWMMLLDLYRLTGQKQRFESRVLDYATRFERSPPPWQDLSRTPARVPARPLVTLSGSLSAQAAGQFEQIAIIGKKSGIIRIDVGQLRSIDETGCAAFRSVLAGLAAERVEVSLLNGARFADMLAGQVQAGRAEGRDAWLLLLETLQHTGEQDRFEGLAVDYAVTFEESPPSWEPKAERAAATTGTLDAAAFEPDGFGLEGELAGAAAAESLRALAALGAESERVEVDCARLQRIDFVAAGMLFNSLAGLRTQGKQIILKNVNAMVAALLRVIGVDQVAQVTPRA